MMAISPAHPFHMFVSPFLPSDENLDETAKHFGTPIDMDNKVNKITYQKSRLFVFLVFILFANLISLISVFLFGDPF